MTAFNDSPRTESVTLPISFSEKTYDIVFVKFVQNEASFSSDLSNCQFYAPLSIFRLRSNDDDQILVCYGMVQPLLSVPIYNH